MQADKTHTCNKKLLLPEAAEIIGILEAVTTDSLILRCRGYYVRIHLSPDVRERAHNFIGKKIAVVRIGNEFRIRDVKEIDPSISQTLESMTQAFRGTLRER